jgi:hypothetical protein
MAIFHLTAKIISRGKGQSAIAAAAYRSGERLRDEQADEQKFYQTRAERILFTDIMTPSNAPEWAHDRNELWNHAERAEKRKDAQLAREIEVALPHEMTDQQREYLVKDFAREQFSRKGYAVDIAIHAPDKDSDGRNYHAHMMVTMRTLGEEGFAAKKDRELNSSAQLGVWREQFAHLTNRHLERHGIDARVDHRSLKEQGIEREPTVHVGYAGMEMDARGAQSDRMDALKAVLERNDLRIEIKALDGELRELGRLEEKERADAAVLAKAEADRQRTAEAAGRLGGSVNPAEPAPAPQTAQEPRQSVLESAAPNPAASTLSPREEAQQEAWRANVEAHQPGQPRPVEAGLQVVDAATGAVSKLADFMSDLLSSPSAKPQEKPADLKAFVSDPAARKEQQLARLAATREAQADEQALENIKRDMKAGKNLRASDIHNLTRAHQDSIHTFGDKAVRDMVEASRKMSESHWSRAGRDQGHERERERD